MTPCLTKCNREAVAETEGERSTLVVSFCCLDYARALDVITLRLHRMRRRIADKLETRFHTSSRLYQFTY